MTAFLPVWFIASLAAAAWGMLEAFAGSMSDDPYAGEAAGKSGCIIALSGIASLVICIVVWFAQ